jgi:hypothetical protein
MIVDDTGGPPADPFTNTHCRPAQTLSDALVDQSGKVTWIDQKIAPLGIASQLFDIKIKEMSGGNGTAPAAP